MTRKDLLENALRMITQRAGLGSGSGFQVVQLSRDGEGLYLLEFLPPQGEKMCEAVGREVRGFPADRHATCIPLLPAVVEEIIQCAQPSLCARRGP